MIELYDNGHGVNTLGKCSPDKRLLEYKKTRELVRDIVAKRRMMGYDARILVPEDADISLEERVERVNAICAKYGKDNVLLVSVHCNAAGADGKWHDASGWSGWVAPNASAKSKKLAQYLYQEAEKVGLKGDRWVPACQYWVKSLAMVRDTNCPAVLTENLFQDNKGDVDILLSEEGHNKIVNLHVDGVERYIKSLR